MKSNLLKYKGYLGSVEVDLESNTIGGEILFINDLVTYEADTIDDLRTQFEAAVDSYLVTCKQFGKEPCKPLSGTLNVRIGPDLHRELAIEATQNGVSINEVIKNAIENFFAGSQVVRHEHNHLHIHEQAPQAIFKLQGHTEAWKIGEKEWPTKATSILN